MNHAPDRRDSATPSATTYILVWLALVVLATASLLLSQVALGRWSVVVALAIAAVKAVLVLSFFMHLASGRPVHRLVIVVAIGFLVLLVAGVLGDVAGRPAASVYVEPSALEQPP